MIKNNCQITEGDYKTDIYNRITNARTGEDFESVSSDLRYIISNGLLVYGEASDYVMRLMFERSKFEVSKTN